MVLPKCTTTAEAEAALGFLKLNVAIGKNCQHQLKSRIFMVSMTFAQDLR